MKNIVVFGAAGYIGAYLIDYCRQHLDSNKFRLIAAGRRDTDFFEQYDIPYYRVDVTRPEDFEKLPREDIFAAVNLTGLLPAYCRSDSPFPYIDTNISGSLRIMEYARECRADRVLYTQTWAEQAGYWGRREVLSPELPASLLYTGDHAFYSITKTMVVHSMRYYQEQFGIKSFVFRLPNVYMYAPQKYYYVDGVERPIGYRRMIELAESGSDMELWGDPGAFKDILYIKDLCQMMCKALTADRNGGTYNAGTGVKTTLREQIEGIVRVFSPCPERVRMIERPEKGTFTSFVMDIGNAAEELGYAPEYDYIAYLEDYKKEQQLKRFDRLWQKKEVI